MRKLSDEKMIELYLDQCRRIPLAKTTIYTRTHALEAFRRDCGVRNATRDKITEWLERPTLKSIGSKATCRTTILVLYDWLIDEELLPAPNPVKKIPRFKVPAGEPKPIPGEELTKALRNAKSDKTMLAWLMLMSGSGLRCCEVATLRREDIHEHDEAPWLHVEYAKGNKTRNVALHAEVSQALLKLDLPVSGPLWPQIDAQSLSKRVNRFLKAAGSQSTAHKLRSYAATEYWAALEAAGVQDILALTDFLGHSDPKTSMIYTKRDQRKGALAMAHFKIGA